MSAREKEKLNEYADLDFYDWKPFVVETHGAVGSTADTLLIDLSNRAVDCASFFSASMSTEAIRRKLLHSWRSSLSVAIQAGNAHILIVGALKCKRILKIGQLTTSPSKRATAIADHSAFVAAELPSSVVV